TNRLRIVRQGRSACIDGAWRISSGNSLEYWLNSPAQWKRTSGLPPKISFDGKWKLSEQDDLQLSVARASYMPEAISGLSRITLNGRIISAEQDSLVFETRSIDDNGNLHAGLLRLTGSWGTDDSNRITFRVCRRAEPDTLTLSGSWFINDSQHITYTMEKRGLAGGDRSASSVEFAGYWNIDSSKRVAYILQGNGASRFDLKAQIETPNVYPQAGVIKYRLGAGIRGQGGRIPRVICLYGQWKIGRKLGVSYEMEYEKGRIRSIEFGGRVDLSRKDRIELSLLNARGEAIGARLIFTRRFLKALDAELFLRLKQAGKERSIDAGVTIPF
ncbi:MAG TPA: hypothetical protein PLJ26_03635, partial [Candidatus Omnitrophota bacterium]|nr:hypothetical protein [Candidatus Omnitrophota bacterium]